VLNILRAARTQLKTTTMDTPFQRLNVRANKMKTNEEGTFYKKNVITFYDYVNYFISFEKLSNSFI